MMQKKMKGVGKISISSRQVNESTSYVKFYLPSLNRKNSTKVGLQKKKKETEYPTTAIKTHLTFENVATLRFYVLPVI